MNQSVAKLRAFALISALAIFGLFAVAIFAKSPYSVIALALTPIPFVILIFVSVTRLRLAIRSFRKARQLRNHEGDQ